MSKICFKARRNGRTVQLIQHQYSSATGRSQTVTLGSLSIDADPNAYEAELKLRTGVTLGSTDRLAISAWLQRHGDSTTRKHRQTQQAALEARLRAEITASLVTEADPIRHAINALATLRKAFPEHALAVQQNGGDVWKELRPHYLELAGEWDRWLKTAQANGVAKKITRRSKLAT
jgi:hypothetical protein